jgi:protein-S-isoprenylcysteine O-methyltransferase Ste14
MPAETLSVLLALLAFGVLHSLTAALELKSLFAAFFGERAYLGLYRLLYNMVSVFTLAPVFFLILAYPGPVVWSLGGVGAGVFYALQGLGLLGLGASLLQIDGLRFLGLSQALAWLNGDKLPLPPEPLATGGVYALTRHPLYFFSLLFLWFSPSLSAAGLGLNIGATLYFCLGSWLEESKLGREFGQAYADYQARVAWMIPFIRLRLPGR